MKSRQSKQLFSVVGSAAVTILTATNGQAESNPFQTQTLANGYMLVAAAETGKGENTPFKETAKDKAPSINTKPHHQPEVIRAPEGTCGGSPLKAGEGACGNMGKNKKKKL